MVGGQGFHYGANVTVPEGPHTITLTIGPATMQVMAAAKGRYARAVTVVFERPPGPEPQLAADFAADSAAS